MRKELTLPQLQHPLVSEQMFKPCVRQQPSIPALATLSNCWETLVHDHYSASMHKKQASRRRPRRLHGRSLHNKSYEDIHPSNAFPPHSSPPSRHCQGPQTQSGQHHPHPTGGPGGIAALEAPLAALRKAPPSVRGSLGVGTFLYPPGGCSK